ncbi:hypothetical protein DIPPA_34569 [Diplonema papillatum]|nr:hypothetical protein DIPPA_34569 [Diplonema papillatum]
MPSSQKSVVICVSSLFVLAVLFQFGAVPMPRSQSLAGFEEELAMGLNVPITELMAKIDELDLAEANTAEGADRAAAKVEMPKEDEEDYQYPESGLTAQQQAYAKTPPALLGLAAARKAEDNGWPARWNNRQHPTHFLLGTPKGGTTFVERCYHSGALSGNPDHLPYPKASMRWPVKFTDDGEPYHKHQGFIGSHPWPRTGYRRFDVAKAWRVYIKTTSPQLADKTYRRLFSSMPPVEDDSHKWHVLDATATYLMKPSVADHVKEDHEHAPEKPRFLIMWRDSFRRAFSHYIMIMGRRAGALKPDDFIRRLAFEMNVWNETEGCSALYDPVRLLARPDVVPLLGELLPKCFRPKSFLGHSLPVLGLRYWLSKFEAKQFTVVRTEALKTSDPSVLISILEKAFGHTRIADPCTGDDLAALRRSVKDGTAPPAHSRCTWPGVYERAVENCYDPTVVGGVRPGSFSANAKKLNLRLGRQERRKPFLDLFELYDDAMRRVIKEFGVTFIDGEAGN